MRGHIVKILYLRLFERDVISDINVQPLHIYIYVQSMNIFKHESVLFFFNSHLPVYRISKIA